MCNRSCNSCCNNSAAKIIGSTIINSERAGADGLSTYEIAVNTGQFTGTEAEFVEWSKGATGNTQYPVFSNNLFNT